MRGRPRKPLPDLILDGGFRHDRHGSPDELWIADGVPDKPQWLEGAASDLWDALVPDLAQRGVAASVDAAELASGCDWWGKYRDAIEAMRGHAVDSKDYYRLQIQAGMAWKNFAAVAAKFGLNPSDRARLRLEPKPQADDLLEFANGPDDKTMDQKRSG